MNPTALRGLYALIDTTWIAPEALSAACAAAISGGARIVQYRDKKASASERLDRAQRLFQVCRQLGALFIVNDDLELAFALNAHGVHLGEQDDTIQAARQRLGPLAIIGASCYDSVVNAQRAAAAGASYLAFGAFFPSSTKPNARHAEPVLLRKARTFGLPLVAIGGITPENGAELIAAGADALAVSSGLLVGDIAANARRYAAIFER
jgi:thiamine-phosphate pyrophosphorylase